MPKDKCVSLKESEGHRERVIMAERTRIAAREDRCPWESLLARIAVCEDRWGDNSHCGKCRCVRGHRACVRPRALSHLEACWKNRRSMCCHAQCGCGYGTWMLQDDRTAFIWQKKVCCKRSTEWSQEVDKAKTYWIGAKSKFLFNLQAVLYYCCVFNLVMNYPMIITTPRNWYCKNA